MFMLTIVSHMRMGCNTNMSLGHVKALVIVMFAWVREFS